eukprot:3168127-Pyramimonas_sp.AAC.1
MLALRMYSCERRLAWSGASSEPVYASRGVLPGCSMAVFILQLVLLTPAGSLHGSSIHIDRALHVYADDLTMQVKAKMAEIYEHACYVLTGVVDPLGSVDLAPAE